MDLKLTVKSQPYCVCVCVSVCLSVFVFLVHGMHELLTWYRVTCLFCNCYYSLHVQVAFCFLTRSNVTAWGVTVNALVITME